jgi:hypothetical protein
MKLQSLIFILLLSGRVACPAQSPSHLTTDLLEHTDRVFIGGYPSSISLSELGTAVERCQFVQIRNSAPYLGWKVNSDRPNTLQTAYRILLASSTELLANNEADMWDSNRTESDNSTAVLYEGKPLLPSTVYYWKVKTWDNHSNESPFSPVRSFITADRPDGETARYPLQVTDEYPVRTSILDDGHLLVDFGKDAFGRVKLTVSSDRETDTLTVRLGETLKDGRIDRRPPATVRYAEYRLPLMAGTHTCAIKIRPDRRNAYISENAASPILMREYTGEVLPFRYCETEGQRTPTQIVRQTVHYPFNETASMFHSSDTVLNRIWELCKYSVRATSFAGVYVDGDRERIPYEADALINQLCHYAVDREFALARYSHEYLIRVATWPAEWIMQSTLMAWTDYMYTGNRLSLQRFYDDLKAKNLLCLKEDNGLISTRTGKLTPEVLQSIHFRGEAIRDIVDWPHGETDGFVFTDYNTVVNAYHYEALRLTGLIAGALGYRDDETFYAGEAQRVNERINQLMLDPKKGYYNDGIDTDHSSLHANMFPLTFGIAPEKYTKQICEFIRTRGLACSVYGAQFLLDAIYTAHDAEYGLKLLSSTDERSWYNMIRVGSTISLEAWDNKYKLNQDWNHAWGAAAVNLITRKLMGIEPIEPGFRKIRIKPQPATLQYAEIKTPSIRGEIYVTFENRNDGAFMLDVGIPANTAAEVFLPKPSKKYRLTVDGLPKKGTVNGNFVTVEIGSGKHLLELRTS